MLINGLFGTIVGIVDRPAGTECGTVSIFKMTSRASFSMFKNDNFTCSSPW
jgi:hypothetical protein